VEEQGSKGSPLAAHLPIRSPAMRDNMRGETTLSADSAPRASIDRAGGSAGDRAGDIAIDRPHVAWWIAVLSGLAVLALDAFSPAVYAWWTANLVALPDRTVLVVIFAGAVALHIGEALYASSSGTSAASPASATGASSAEASGSTRGGCGGSTAP